MAIKEHSDTYPNKTTIQKRICNYKTKVLQLILKLSSPSLQNGLKALVVTEVLLVVLMAYTEAVVVSCCV